MSKTFYQKLLARKSNWTPVCSEAGLVTPGAESAVMRFLELRILELPVGDYIAEASRLEKSRMTPDIEELLLSNIQDEVKHDLVLNMAAHAYRDVLPFNDEDTATARSIAQRWIDHPDHPIVKAAVAESSLFFVGLPILRFFGGQPLRMVSGDISNDEQGHVSTNRQLCLDWSLTWSESLNQLRRDTVAWVVEDLEAEGKFGYPDVWMKSSDSLLEKGVAPLLNETKAATMTAFFETSNNVIQVYS